MKLITFTLILFTHISFAGLALETNSFLEIEKKAVELGKKHGNKNVLLVFDIDNTIMAMPQDLGSDQWFGWQYNSCIKTKSKADYCVTNNMGELLSVLGKLFSLSKMIPTEPDAPKVIKRLQKAGFKVILLTSRGPSYRNATERELGRNGYDLRASAIGPKGGYPSTYLPYQLTKYKQYGISTKMANKAKLSKPRAISYMNGVMMTAGLNKGIMLKTLLNKTGSKFKAIIFSDDHSRHTKTMQAIMGELKAIDLVTYRYGKIDPQVKAFKASDKKTVIQAYKNYHTVMEKVFK